MNVYWFTIGDFSLRAYGTVLVLAFFLSMGVAVFLARSSGRKEWTGRIVDMSLYAIFGGLLGARLWHVFVFNWDYYSHNLAEIVKVWHGGLAIQGGIIGGVAVAVFYCWRKQISFWSMADVCAPALVFGQSIGRCANLLNGDGLGGPTGGDYGVVYPPGTNAFAEYGAQPLWPAEVWEGQIDIVIFALLLIFRLKKWPSGYIFLFYGLMYSMNRFGMEYLRGDTSRLMGISLAQWTAIAFALVALVFLVLRRKAPAELGVGSRHEGDINVNHEKAAMLQTAEPPKKNGNHQAGKRIEKRMGEQTDEQTEGRTDQPTDDQANHQILDHSMDQMNGRVDDHENDHYDYENDQGSVEGWIEGWLKDSLTEDGMEDLPDETSPKESIPKEQVKANNDLSDRPLGYNEDGVSTELGNVLLGENASDHVLRNADNEGKDSEGKDSEGKDSEGKDSEGKDSEGKDSEGNRNQNTWVKIEEKEEIDAGLKAFEEEATRIEDNKVDHHKATGETEKKDPDQAPDQAPESPMPIEIPPYADIPVLKDSFRGSRDEDD